jgi:hypothetical protein
MQPFPSPFPRNVPPVKRPVRRMASLFGVIVGGILLFVGGFWIYGRLTPQHVVVIANDNDFAVEVDAGGKRVSLAPHASDWVRAHDGTLTVTASGGNRFSETATLELPATGWSTAGRTALYNVGGTAKLAIVSITYGAGSSTTPVQLIRDKVVLLPVGASGQIDEAFPKQVRTNRIGTVRQHVCHIDVEAKRVGCPGAFAD